MTTELKETGYGERPPIRSLGYAVGDPFALPGVIQLREEYVTAMRWHPDCEEGADRYDQSINTIHIAKTSETNPEYVEAAMRLTPVANLETSLSFEMISHDDELSRQVLSHEDREKLNTAGENGRLWDLTRLVATLDTGVPSSQKVTAILEMIGAGIVLTCPKLEEDAETQWIFATNRAMKRVFDMVGIQYSVLASGTMAGDRSPTYFCKAKPQEAFDFAMNHREQYGPT
ncbi:hypothetical protein B7Z17_04940, partial [Candidatus Saccharibacteria bacterium 32-49-10]